MTNKRRFESILADLVDENTFACRAVLSLAGLRFTDEVETLAVTLEERPVLQVNPEFLKKHAQTEDDMRSVILHEFLHILLGHTEQFRRMTPALNLALDAVINNILQRQFGDDCGKFFRQYYGRAAGLTRLLVPLSEHQYENYGYANDDFIRGLQSKLYEGKVVADDVLSIAEQIVEQLAGGGIRLPRGRYFLGGHQPWPESGNLSREVQDALDRTLLQFNGDGVFRSPRGFWPGGLAYQALFQAKPERLVRWERTATAVLRAFVTPDPRSRNQVVEYREDLLPVLNSRDKRAFLRATWNPIIPEAHWLQEHRRREGTCQVYLDVSGSMNAEMQALVGLLGRLRRWIRMPFWAFSTEVAPAVIRKGQLQAGTTGGTAMNCVLEHVCKTRPGRAVVITDGYIEPCESALLAQLEQLGQKIFVIVTRDGSPHAISKAGLPYRQLEPYPGEEP